MRMIACVLLLVPSTIVFAFYWPLGDGDTPQHITSTFGEWRPASSGAYLPYHQVNHFHDGVDMVPNTGSTVGATVYGVEDEYCWDNGFLPWPQYNYIMRTNYHDYIHVVPDTALHENDPVNWSTIIGWIQNISAPHLHFNGCQYRSSPGTANNVLDPQYGTSLRLDPLFADDIAPWIHEVIFAADENHAVVYPATSIPPNTNIDIIVRAEEISEYPNGTDNNNGVYTLGYYFDYGWYDYRIRFDDEPDDWSLYKVYDPVRQNSTSQFYYVITNYMGSNGNWYSGAPALHWLYISAKDEQGNDAPYSVFVNVSTGVEEENVAEPSIQNGLNTISPNPGRNRININYQIANTCQIGITIFDRIGRVIKKIEKIDGPGIHTFI